MSPPSSSSFANIDILEPLDMISMHYRFEITDGRIITGLLISIDDQSNLLVTEATEYNGSGLARELGLVAIPKTTIQNIGVDKKELEKNIRYRERINGSSSASH
ncbi:unnamed protein product [Ambrosiozyma monospora]|uniref:Unnamed protein product n=1 Tax=Ambrosiozyma monospora TaxID=43982 RepID=A0ACB5SZ32_AMBMO|nr:unnamed protein product [Ambrosiozyma monospora]